MEALKKAIRPLAKWILGNRYDHVFGYKRCNVCGRRCIMEPIPAWYLYHWQLHGFQHNPLLFETQNLANYTCSKCGASDRERLYALFLKGWLQERQQVRLLDIAPAKALSKWLKQQSAIIYRSCDLDRDDVDDQVDMTDMRLYPNNSFDFVICSHVLEHIPDDKKAMRELFRVLKPGAEAIVMVPLIMGNLETVENQQLDKKTFCWKYYGQSDHVRLYAKHEFIGRLQQTGFQVTEWSEQHFGRQVFKHFDILPYSVLYIVRKNNTPPYDQTILEKTPTNQVC